MGATVCPKACLVVQGHARQARRVCPRCRAHVVARARATSNKDAAAECNVSAASVGAWVLIEEHIDLIARHAADAYRRAMRTAHG